MADYFSNVATPLTFAYIEQKPAPPFMTWLQPNEGRGALHAEVPIVQRAIEESSFAEPDWDGYGALPIAEATKQNAIAGMKSLLLEAPTPDITPNPNGTLSFEWTTTNGTAHLEIGQTQFSFYINPQIGAPILFAGSADRISRLHGSLIAKLLFPVSTTASAATPIRYSGNV